MVDDASHFMWVSLLATKDAYVDAIKKIKAEAEKESSHMLKVLHTNNGGEFTLAEFVDYYTSEGVQRYFSTPHRRSRTAWWNVRNRPWSPLLLIVDNS